ncbi:unnamed protein product [Urochloa humidicola]
MKDDAGMSTSPRGEKTQTASSDDGSKNALTTSTVSDGRVVSVSVVATEKPADEVPMSCRSPETPTSCGGEKAHGPVRVIGGHGHGGRVERDAAADHEHVRQDSRACSSSASRCPRCACPWPWDLDGVVVVLKDEEKPDTDSKVIRTQQHQPQQVKKDGARVFAEHSPEF